MIGRHPERPEIAFHQNIQTGQVILAVFQDFRLLRQAIRVDGPAIEFLSPDFVGDHEAPLVAGPPISGHVGQPHARGPPGGPTGDFQPLHVQGIGLTPLPQSGGRLFDTQAQQAPQFVFLPGDDPDEVGRTVHAAKSQLDVLGRNDKVFLRRLEGEGDDDPGGHAVQAV